MITRRCYERTFRLRPSEQTNATFEYCLARAAKKSGVVIHAVCVMSNHHHSVVTDVEGKLPLFLQELHRETAKALNAAQGHWESLWSSGKTHAALLAEPEDVLRKMAYVIANPVDAGLVAQPEEWPGVLLWGEHRRRVRRPGVYFDAKGHAEELLDLVISPPSAAGAFPRWEERLRAEVAALVCRAHAAMRRRGWRFLGRAAVLGASFIARAQGYEVRRGVVPRIAAIRREVRMATIEAYRRFRAAYAGALEAWKAGARGAVFPAGTWWMRVHHGAVVEPLGDAA